MRAKTEKTKVLDQNHLQLKSRRKAINTLYIQTHYHQTRFCRNTKMPWPYGGHPWYNAPPKKASVTKYISCAVKNSDTNRATAPSHARRSTVWNVNHKWDVRFPSGRSEVKIRFLSTIKNDNVELQPLWQTKHIRIPSSTKHGEH